MTPMGGQHRILIADDDKNMRESLVDLMSAAGWQARAVPRADQVAALLSDFQPDVVLSDVRMPGMSGLELLASFDKALSPPLVLISAHGDIPMAVQAIQDGAYSFVEKPHDPRRLLQILQHAAEQHRMLRNAQRLKERLARLSGLDRILLGQTEEIRQLREDVLDLTDTEAPVMLLGETGTGKELVARALHNLSPRVDGPFVAINCASIPSDNFEAEMFGSLNGARGLLRAADGGTLFLDELCACPPDVQAKFLRVIEGQEVTPLGGDHAEPVNFRVLSASNEDPEKAVEEKRFRKDLLFRLNTVVLTLPTLRERRADLMMLYAHFVDDYAGVYELDTPELSQDDMAALMAHDWPGNVRELRHVAERRVLAARRGRGSISEAIRADQDLSDVPDTLREAVAVFERELVAKAIRANRGRMDAVAESLGIGRRTLNEKIVKLGLTKDDLL